MNHNDFLAQLEPDRIGKCDVCDYRYDVASRVDHCGEEGLCWTHCTDPLGHEDRFLPDGTLILGGHH